ncbi:HD domain-containing protein [bacterium]|nr:HD domain-containing protein [bacterium]
MNSDQQKHWEAIFEKKILASNSGNDPAHDLAHFRRVVATAKKLCAEENACWEVVVPAAWLHDLVNVPKNDPRRSQASRLSAEASIDFLRSEGYPSEYFDGITHAIEAHSFSAQIECRSIEAAIVQDADRLDGLGAIGIARCFAVAGLLKRALYEPSDPFGLNRELDDLKYTIDHFFVKLFKVADTLRTPSGKVEGQRRAQFMRQFLDQLAAEIHAARE